MRLLNSYTRQLQEFLSDDNILPYAILSHTWGNGEVTLQDWENLPTRPAEILEKPGLTKIEHCCNQAALDGLEWVWIDTQVFPFFLDIPI